MSTKHRLSASALLVFSCCQPARADLNEAKELAEFMAMLNAETAIATQNKMNAAYVPGMVTVLHGDDLAEQGVQQLADALNKVAGFHSLHNNNGDSVTLVRGIGSTLNGSNIKLLLDGMAVNRPLDASADWLLRFPISQIERIEVIRGPGSVLYGEYAFAGVVNVITRKSQRASVKLGNDGYRQGDLMWQHQTASGLTLALNLSARSQHASGLYTNPDNFVLDGGYSPAPVNDQEDGNYASLKADYQGYQLAILRAEVKRGGWYGRNAAMPKAMEPRQETATNMQLNKSWALTDDLSAELSLLSREDSLHDATFLPIIGGLRRPGSGPNEPLTVERFVRDVTDMQSRQAALKVHWRAHAQHQLFLATDLSKSEIENAYRAVRFVDEPLSPMPPATAPVQPDASRIYKSVTMQDEWQAADQLTLTFGARYDHYDDWGSHVTPRFAAVWQLNEAHLLKTQYSEAFRPPTLAEAFAPSNGLTGDSGRHLVEESLRSAEMAYIYRVPGFSLRTTVFNTDIDDLIEYYQRPGANPIWRNQGEIDSRGVELELTRQLDRHWSWFANLSYVDANTNVDDSDGVPTGAIKWLASAGLSWRPDGFGVHSLSLNYTGSQEGYDLNLRQQLTRKFAAVRLLDYSLTLHDIRGVTGLQANISINNLLDKAYHVVPNPLQYPLGLPEQRRRLSAGLQYSF